MIGVSRPGTAQVGRIVSSLFRGDSHDKIRVTPRAMFKVAPWLCLSADNV